MKSINLAENWLNIRYKLYIINFFLLNLQSFKLKFGFNLKIKFNINIIILIFLVVLWIK